MAVRHVWLLFALACALVVLPRLATAQTPLSTDAATQAEGEASASVVVKKTHPSRERLGVGDVGQELVSASPVGRRLAGHRAKAMPQQQDEVTTSEFTRGALIGGAAGAAAGALVGAVLGGDRNQRWETALPVAAAGLAAGAPTGVYVYTGRPSRYLWGTAGAAGAVALGTVLYFVETR